MLQSTFFAYPCGDDFRARLWLDLTASMFTPSYNNMGIFKARFTPLFLQKSPPHSVDKDDIDDLCLAERLGSLATDPVIDFSHIARFTIAARVDANIVSTRTDALRAYSYSNLLSDYRKDFFLISIKRTHLLSISG